MIAHFDQIEVSWSSTLFITEDVKTSHLIPRFPSTLQEKRVEVGNYPRALANFAKNIRRRKPYLRRALSVQQSA